MKGKDSVAYRTTSTESSCGSSLVTDPKGPSDMNVQSAYLHSAFLEVQFWQAGLPSSPMAGISTRYISVTARSGSCIISHFLRRLRHVRHPLRDRRFSSGTCLITGILLHQRLQWSTMGPAYHQADHLSRESGYNKVKSHRLATKQCQGKG